MAPSGAPFLAWRREIANCERDSFFRKLSDENFPIRKYSSSAHPADAIRTATKHCVCGRVGSMPKINVNLAEAATSIFKAKNIIQGPFRGMANQVTEPNIQLPLVNLFEVVDLQNQALEKLQIELEKLVKQ
jgi:hypothetical protein